MLEEMPVKKKPTIACPDCGAGLWAEWDPDRWKGADNGISVRTHVPPGELKLHVVCGECGVDYHVEYALREMWKLLPDVGWVKLDIERVDSVEEVI